MKVSFIIPLFNGLELTQAMLSSLHETVPEGLDYEVVLVDNASTDGTARWAASLGGRHRVLQNRENAGYARANNQGARAARGDVLALLNNDLVLLPGWIEPMLAALAKDPAALVGNVQLTVRSPAIDHAGIYFDTGGCPYHHRPPLAFTSQPGTVTVPAVTGACVLVSRDRFLALAGFDEGFVNGYEDVDLSLRVTAAGGRCLVVPGSVVFHHVGATPGRHLAEDLNARRFQDRWAGRTPVGAPPRGTEAESSRPNPAELAARSHLAFQTYRPGEGGYAEARSSIQLYRAGSSVVLRVRLPEGLHCGAVGIRFDPCQCPAVTEIHSFSVLDELDRVVWKESGEALAPVFQAGGTAHVDTAGPGFRIRSTGDDPQLILRPAAIPAGLPVRAMVAEFALRTEPDAPGPRS